MCNICVIGTPEGEEREHRIEEIFEVLMAENIPKLIVDRKILILEGQETSQGTNAK